MSLGTAAGQQMIDDLRLLVADEIISMLDASTRIDVLNLLGDLKARGLGTSGSSASRGTPTPGRC